jgi:uncharacterized protein (DUF1330 family)
MTPSEELHDEVLAAIPDGVSVVMVNLMKFKPHSDDGEGSGWDAYLRYSKATSPLIKAHGGAIIWAGHASGAAFGSASFGDWDYVALVRYPSKSAFRDMIVSADYEPGNRHRLNGVERHVIIATEEAYGRFRND